MEIKGKLTELLPEQTGQGKTGNTWRKGGFIIETLDDNYPKKIALEVWGDIVDKIPSVGNIAICQVDPESREYNSRWYTSLKAWKIEVENAAPVNSNTVENTNSSDPNNDLPF
jgi:hypothetical protein